MNPNIVPSQQNVSQPPIINQTPPPIVPQKKSRIWLWLIIIILLIVIVVLGGIYFYQKNNKPSKIAVSTDIPLSVIQDNITNVFTESRFPNLYITPIPYSAIVPATNIASLTPITEIPGISFKGSWKYLSSSLSYPVGTVIVSNTQIKVPWYENAYIELLNVATSSDSYFSPARYFFSTLEKPYADADKKALSFAKTNTIQGFVDYIFSLNPNDIVQTQNQALAQADYRLLYQMKGGLFEFIQGGANSTDTASGVYKFQTPTISGYILQPKLSDNSIVIFAFSSSGNLYQFKLSPASQFTKTDVDTFISSFVIN